MKKFSLRQYFRASAVALAASLVLGCGGGGDSTPLVIEQPTTVAVDESARLFSPLPAIFYYGAATNT